VLKRMAWIALLSSVVSWLLPNTSSAEILITEAEARLPRDHDAGMPTRGITRGPGIEQLLPQVDPPSSSPFSLRIKFHSRNRVEIDPSSIRLTYLTRPPVDLTERVRKYVGPEGIELFDAEVPPGVHLLRVELKDKQGRPSSIIIKFNVAAK
jgi:hypothetical protein